MKLRNKVLCLVMALLLLVPYVTGTVVFAAPNDNDLLNIGTAEEFVEFAHNCSLDSWSNGKTFTLTANIDLTGYENINVPTFNGTFNGSDFTISGVVLDGFGTNQGLFRSLRKGAIIKELTVNATIIADGTAYNIGGIVGNNAGTIRNCEFNGTVIGDTAVGGIVGTNEVSGNISECVSKGFVNGVNSVGGITGVNHGKITKCVNYASIGTESLEDVSVDIGGIAGYSTGTIESSTNTGTVGVLHSGYNVGGVVGRQDGLVNGAVNDGEVYGRKDVGGIVGQGEPNIKVVFTDDLLEKLKTELTSLHSLINDSLTDANDLTADVQKRLKNASDYANKASSSTNSLLSQLSGAVSGGGNNNLTSSTALIYSSLGNYSAVLQDMRSAADDLADSVEQIIAVLKTISNISGSGVASISKAQTAAGELEDSVEDIDEALAAIEANISSLRNAVLQENEANMQEALTKLADNITNLGDAFEESSEAVSDVRKNLAGLMGSDATRQTKIQDAMKKVSSALEKMAEDADTMSSAVKKIDAKVEVNWTALQENLKSMAAGAKNMCASAGNVQTGLEDAAELLDEFESALSSLNEPADKMGAAADAGGEAFKYMATALSKVESYLTDLAEADPSDSAASLGSSFTTQSQTLYRAIVSMSSELSGLSTDIGDGNTAYAENVKAINDQLLKVMNLVVDAIEDTGSNDSGITDISDESVSTASAGKLLACTNNGVVTGDREVGGVVGSMSIENELNREDEQNDTLSAENQYEIMAVVTGCVNEGVVIGTKESVGGIAGRMELGTVIDCENYGEITGEGSYTGGIAGLSNASVRRSYSKSLISGESYVGGIVGLGNRVDSCYSIVVIDGKEFVGAIAGMGDTLGELVTDNYYLDNGVAAIDDVSYHEIAEPIALDALKNRNGLPNDFINFTITCMGDDEVVDTVKVTYGTDISAVQLPTVPEKEGFYGYWSGFTTEQMLINQTVYAEYSRGMTLVSSDELDQGRAFALAEGNFTNSVELHVYASEETTPFNDAWGIWNVSLTDTNITDETVTTVKLLNQTRELATIWQLKDGEWEELDTVRDGQYLKISMIGTAGTFCFRSDYKVIGLIGLILLVAIIDNIIIVVIIVKNRKKKKGKRKVVKAPATDEFNGELNLQLSKKEKSAKAQKDKQAMKKAKRVLKKEAKVAKQAEKAIRKEEELAKKEALAADRQAERALRQEEELAKRTALAADRQAEKALKQEEKLANKAAKEANKQAEKKVRLEIKEANKKAAEAAKSAKQETKAVKEPLAEPEDEATKAPELETISLEAMIFEEPKAEPAQPEDEATKAVDEETISQETVVEEPKAEPAQPEDEATKAVDEEIISQETAIVEEPEAEPVKPEIKVAKKSAAVPVKAKIKLAKKPVTEPAKPKIKVAKKSVVEPEQPGIKAAETPVVEPEQSEIEVAETPVVEPVQPEIRAAEIPVEEPAQTEYSVSETPEEDLEVPEFVAYKAPVEEPEQPEYRVSEKPAAEPEYRASETPVDDLEVPEFMAYKAPVVEPAQPKYRVSEKPAAEPKYKASEIPEEDLEVPVFVVFEEPTEEPEQPKYRVAEAPVVEPKKPEFMIAEESEVAEVEDISLETKIAEKAYEIKQPVLRDDTDGLFMINLRLSDEDEDTHQSRGATRRREKSDKKRAKRALDRNREAE